MLSERLRKEILRFFEIGYILEKIGKHHRIYFKADSPKRKKAVFDAVDPTSTFYADTLSGYIERRNYFYPPTTEYKYQGSQVDMRVGQDQIGTGNAVLLPNGDTPNTSWEEQYPPSGSHYDKVDDWPLSDDDATYTRTTAFLGRLELFDFQDYANNYDFSNVIIYARARAEDSPRSLRIAIITHSNGYVGGFAAIPTYYYGIVAGWSQNPYTGLDWTLAEINALQAGVQTAIGASPMRLTQVLTYIYFRRHRMYRSFPSFDTSPLPDDATVNAATFYAAVIDDRSTGAEFDVHLYSGKNQWSDIATMEWNDCTVDEGVWINTSGIAVDTYYSKTVLPSSINLTGRTQFKLVSSREGTKPATNTYEYIEIYGANRPYPPYLIVDYTVPAPPPAVTRAQWPYYMSFAKRAFRTHFNFDQPTATKEVDALKDEFVKRGLNRDVLDQLAAIAKTKGELAKQED